MADAIKVAQSRRDEYKEDIAKKEAEIEELKELISDLDSFIEFGEALVGDGPAESESSDTSTKPTKVISKAVVSKPAPHQQAPRAVVSDGQDDEWGSDNTDNNISRVLAARNG